MPRLPLQQPRNVGAQIRSMGRGYRPDIVDGENDLGLEYPKTPHLPRGVFLFSIVPPSRMCSLTSTVVRVNEQTIFKVPRKMKTPAAGAGAEARPTHFRGVNNFISGGSVNTARL